MMTAIRELLRQTIGLEAATIGESTVESVVRGRMIAAGVHTAEEYLRRLHESPAEMHELVEAVVVPESWFFRDGAPFTALASWTREHWLPEHPGGTLRVLTIPCSTGEEPYSVAMTLLDAGLPPGSFTVDAVDISHRAVARARQATYGPNSFRGRDLGFRDRYFSEEQKIYTLKPEARAAVRFETGNLLAESFRPGAGRFDVIFCRNLLIYFDRPTQARAVHTLGGMLTANGLLFVGHAESNVAVSAGFVSANYPSAFAFRKASPLPPLLPPAKSPVTTLRPNAATATRRVAPATPRFTPKPPTTRFLPGFSDKPTVPVTPRLPVRSAPEKAALQPGALESARALADQGKLTEAARLCEDHLRQNVAAADAWYLLGVVRDAAGDRRRAAECYTKTLYLEPEHQEALLQRALLAEQSGDTATAAQLRRRIARVQERSGRP